MGTNYYVPAPPPCGSCGRPHEAIHIGKQSFGWAFGWDLLPDDEDGEATTQAGWWAYLEGKPIEDEYGRPVTLDNLRALVASTAGRMVLTRENIGDYGDPAKYERIGPEGERITRSRGFS